MFHVDQIIGMCLMLIVVYGLLLLLKRPKMKYTRIYSKNAFCRSINCEALGYFGCSIPGCRHTAKDLERWLKQNKYGITTENKS